MWRLRTSGGRFLTIAGLPATLGSDARNDLRLRHASILEEHARFSDGPDGRLAVEALGEAVVGVGGKKVARGTVGDGDELILGRLRFTVERAGAPAKPAGRPARQAAASDEGLLQPRKPARAKARARAPAASADELISVRDKTLRFNRKPDKGGLLNVEFGQLSAGWKALIVLALLLVGAGLLWGVALLTGLLG